MAFRTILIPFVVFSILLCCGCASSTSGTSTAAVVKHPESVVLKVTGGSDTAASSTSQVSRKHFVAELAKSLNHAGLFTKVLSDEQAAADYRLEIAVADLQRPEVGARMTATVDAKWSLVRVSNGYEIWQKTISSSHTTQPNEAFTGVERLRLAIEGAASANIQDGIQQLAATSIP